MDVQGFRAFLASRYPSKKSVDSRMSRARKAERILEYDLDKAVSSDKKMKEALLIIKEQDNREENYQNATRCYYEFKVGKVFPKLDKI